MIDPYKVLGVSQGVSDKVLEDAYHALMRKYHPDAYAGHALSDFASEKMEQINEAYRQILSARGLQEIAKDSSEALGSSSRFAAVRLMIGQKRMIEAGMALDGVPAEAQDAEWYFLKGTTRRCRGLLDTAYANIAMACEMDLNNVEYETAKNNWTNSERRQVPMAMRALTVKMLKVFQVNVGMTVPRGAVSKLVVICFAHLLTVFVIAFEQRPAQNYNRKEAKAG